MAHPGRRRDRGPARRAADQGPDRPGAAHRARPGGSWIPSVLAAADKRLSEVRRHVPDAGGLVIATDQDSARAYARAAPGDHRGDADRRALRREAGSEEDRRVHRRARTAGWSRSGWSPRASTCRGWRSGSTPPRPRRRCSSRRRSAASCGPASRGETASVFLPSVPVLLALRRPRWRSSATTCWAAKITDEATSSRPRGAAGRGGQRGRGRLRRAGARPSRRSAREARFDRVLFDGGEFGHAVRCTSGPRGDGLPRHPRSARAGPGRELLQPAAERAGRSSRSRRGTRASPRPGRGVHPRAARRPAPRAERPGRRLAPPHRPAPRRHPRRAAQGVRRAGGG